MNWHREMPAVEHHLEPTPHARTEGGALTTIRDSSRREQLPGGSIRFPTLFLWRLDALKGFDAVKFQGFQPGSTHSPLSLSARHWTSNSSAHAEALCLSFLHRQTDCRHISEICFLTGTPTGDACND